MRTRYADDYGQDDSNHKDLRTQDWQAEAIGMNPSYCAWGIHEDYMMDGGGWRKPMEYHTWTDFGPWELNDLNEIVNFYFFAERASRTCQACDGTGYNTETKRISDAFYDFSGTGGRWCDKITQDEADILIDHGRAAPGTTASDFNTKSSPHDAINRWMLVRARAERLGVWGLCDSCDSTGEIFTEEEAHLGLMLWAIYPRKGATCGVEIGRIERQELPEVKQFLVAAAKRNAQRFGGITE